MATLHMDYMSKNERYSLVPVSGSAPAISRAAACAEQVRLEWLEAAGWRLLDRQLQRYDQRRRIEETNLRSWILGEDATPGRYACALAAVSSTSERGDIFELLRRPLAGKDIARQIEIAFVSAQRSEA